MIREVLLLLQMEENWSYEVLMKLSALLKGTMMITSCGGSNQQPFSYQSWALTFKLH